MPPYHLNALVLAQHKLGETDLIVTLLAADGSQVRAVAKGARKPASGFAARLEPFTVVDLLVHTGRGALDVISEARILSSHRECRSDPERFALCAVMAELLVQTTVPDEPDAVLFPMTCAALDAADNAVPANMPLITAGHLLKVLAVLGVRPALDECAFCGRPLEPLPASDGSAFTYAGGGRVCASCRDAAVGGIDAVDPVVLSWVQVLLGSTFAQIAAMEIGEVQGTESELSSKLLRFCEAWLRAHLELHLKSLDVCFRSHIV